MCLFEKGGGKGIAKLLGGLIACKGLCRSSRRHCSDVWGSMKLRIRDVFSNLRVPFLGVPRSCWPKVLTYYVPESLSKRIR